MDRTVTRTTDVLDRFRRHAWGVAVLFFGLVDVATTHVGLRIGGIAEVGPVAAPVIQEYGLLGMGLLKLGAFGTCYLMYSVVPSPYDLGVPLGLAALGGVVSAWNAVVIAVMLA